MSEFSTFWSGWIFILTVGNILACLWLVMWTMKKREGESAQGDVTGHTWDGDLQEYNNPLPRWWLWLFYATLVFGVIYLIIYPGVWDGVLKWTSADKSNREVVTTGAPSQYEREMDRAAKRYDPIYQQFRAIAIPELAKNEEANGMGKRLYLTYCMQCHGSDAKGSPGYPNLSDNDWLWGGAPEQIVATLTNGRNGVMPPHAHLGEEKIDQLANYVLSLSGREVDAAKAEAGKQEFTANGCIACHGMDGTGNQMLGGPNLTDNTWFYGGSPGVIKKTITEGRSGVMPAHKALLGEDKIHVLAAYIYSLSN
ncbi:MAG: cytochrome-c oxidase, cbb3-type subunit III [Gammaproteobacteria bacterium SHHR-1]|uniref:cytochrome-c oxidase, cbb3-type subunit III n=1 Tax=Magnetovirga frankeli TaxID=947516 RepID=UPI0012937EE2|nr:cytochrome-c oxidase, cbb3-type subunit III [gamma proteobacterium SS-5]